MSRFAVFGCPIAHSRSPWIHQVFARQCGISLEYSAIEAMPEQFVARLAQFRAEGGRGANVTLPLKEQAASLCQRLTPAARRSGAVNTLIWQENGWLGDNTDGIGLCRDMTANLGYVLQDRRILLLGAGGAARGVVPALCEAGVREIVVANRSLERAVALVQDLAAAGTLSACAMAELAQAGSFDVLINATSAARQGVALTLPQSLIQKKTLAYDLSYGESAQAFLSWAALVGIKTRADGLGMLVEQAAEAFQRWHGLRPETASVLNHLRDDIAG